MWLWMWFEETAGDWPPHVATRALMRLVEWGKAELRVARQSYISRDNPRLQTNN